MKKLIILLILLLGITQTQAQKKKSKTSKRVIIPKIATAPKISPFAMLSANNAFTINTVCVSPDGQQILSSGDDGEVRLWDIATQTQTNNFVGDKNSKGITFPATAVVYSPDGKTFLSAQGGLLPKLWDATSKKVVKRINQKGAGVFSLAFSPDQTLVAFGNDESISINNLPLGTDFKIAMTPRSGQVVSVDFSPDSQSVLAVSDKQEITLWDANTGDKIRNFDIHNYQKDLEYATDAAFTPDGKMIITVGFNKEPYQGIIKMWNPNDGTLIRGMAEEQGLECMSISSDGQKLATGGFDKKVKIWEISTGKLLYELIGHKNFITSVSFGQDNKTIVASSKHGTINVWKI